LVIVDDHLSLLLLAGALTAADFDDDVATTSLWYLRLVSAATTPFSDVRGPGRLARILQSLPDPEAALARILSPPASTLDVLHPMKFARETARLQRERRLNLLAAEMLGAATHHGASLQMAAPNAGGPIERAASSEGISYEVRAST
jgi:cytosine/adenosine deaminase-related metal-dependent hydrolase